MPSLNHPVLIVLAGIGCLALAFPIASFFFDDFETFKDEFGLSRDWEQGLWLLGFVPSNPMIYFKAIGFLGALAIVFLALYNLGLRVAGGGS